MQTINLQCNSFSESSIRLSSNKCLDVRAAGDVVLNENLKNKIHEVLSKYKLIYEYKMLANPVIDRFANVPNKRFQTINIWIQIKINCLPFKVLELWQDLIMTTDITKQWAKTKSRKRLNTCRISSFASTNMELQRTFQDGKQKRSPKSVLVGVF